MSGTVRAGSPAPPGRRPRLRWLLPALGLVLWLVVGSVGGPYQGLLVTQQENDQAAFLPDDVEATEVEKLGEKFVTDATYPGVLVFVRADGAQLSGSDVAAIERFAKGVPAILVPDSAPADAGADAPDRRVGDFLVAGPQGAAQVPVTVSQDHEAALLGLDFDPASMQEVLAGGTTPMAAAVEELRRADGGVADGLEGYVAGPAGLIADFTAAFGAVDATLLAVALIAVLIILLVVYRSPVLPLLVIFSAVTALSAASMAVYFLADGGALTLDGQSQSILSVLVIGATTDYALLLVARYREELRLHDDRFEAMRRAWRRALGPILASGATVIIGLMCLLLSRLESNRSLGPVAALGIGFSVAVGLTMLPALLLLPSALTVLGLVGAGAGIGAAAGAAGGSAGAGVGALLGVVAGALAAVWLLRRSAARARARSAAGRPAEAGRWPFWPTVPHVGSSSAEPTGVWNSLARLVGRRARLVWALTAVVLLALVALAPQLKATGVGQTDMFLTAVEGVEGGEVLAEHFPAGSDTPTVVVSPQQDLERVLATVRATPGVAQAFPLSPQGTADGAPLVVDGRVRIRADLADPSTSAAAQDTVRGLRTALDAVGPDVLVGGYTAVQIDTVSTARRDLGVILPVVLLAILLVLSLLLRALVAPVLVLLVNVLSFGATMGVSAVVFNQVFDFPGIDPGIVLFGFVFLVALGIDYSIFLMTRVREESAELGTRPGIQHGLAVTGGVITSAGLVVAATFAALASVPVLFLAQIAFIVGFGILLDTFVVRSLLLPALAYDLGSSIWLPARLTADRRTGPGPQAPAERRPSSAELGV